jgi:NAD(P)-dependent dehydrogenase (short-subunit alcohol dehydrogenase family)
VADEGSVREMVATAADAWGHVDILHNNVGVSLAGGDDELAEIGPEAFQRVTAINLWGMVLTCKHALPLMRKQHRGVICNISSIAAVIDYPYIAYRTSKAGILALTHNVAIRNAAFGVRANTILPGLLNTPMAIENRIGVLADTREEVIAQRDAKVPLGKQGTGRDVANAALFLASDEAEFITGASLTIDGGQSLVIG